MPGKHYVPRNENQLAAWSSQLVATLSASPGAYGASSAEVAALAAVQSSFASAWKLVQQPRLRSRPYIAVKDEKKRLLVSTTQSLVQRMQNWTGMTDDKRIELGIPVRGWGGRRARISRPTEAPVLQVRMVYGRRISLRLSRAGGGAGKPTGVRGAFVYRYVGAEPPASEKAFEFVGSWTNTRPVVVMGNEVEPGTTVWLCAAWVSPTHQAGPACLARSAMVNTLNFGEME